jgi:hypothetical protein
MMHRRKGYILLAVLGIAVIVTALGLSFVESHSTAMPESVNRYGSMRALYLAESGVAIGSHFLMYPPTTVAFGQYYTGANNVAVDATSDYTDIAVLRSDAWSPAKTDLNLYRITATGVAKDPDGSVRGKRMVTAEVVVPDGAKWRIPYAIIDPNTCTIPANVSIYGDVHANGTLMGYLGSFCNGKVTSSGLATWLGSGPPTSVLSAQPAYTPPAGTVSKYLNYTIKGKDYSAYTAFSNSQITSADSVALNAIDMSATNPGRIICCKSGTFKIRANADLTGTLIVQGRLEIDDAAPHIIRAVDGFPALIVTGDIKFMNDDASLTVLGTVICGGLFDCNGKQRIVSNVTGSLVKSGTFNNVRSDCNVRFTWDVNRSWFWDVESTPTPQPITVLNWKED